MRNTSIVIYRHLGFFLQLLVFTLFASLQRCVNRGRWGISKLSQPRQVIGTPRLPISGWIWKPGENLYGIFWSIIRCFTRFTEVLVQKSWLLQFVLHIHFTYPLNGKWERKGMQILSYHPRKLLIICELCIFQNLWFRGVAKGDGCYPIKSVVDGLWHPYILLKWILWRILWTIAIDISRLDCWSIPVSCLISISCCLHLVVNDPAPPFMVTIHFHGNL